MVYVVYKWACLQASCIITSQFMMYLSNGGNDNESNNVAYKQREQVKLTSLPKELLLTWTVANTLLINTEIIHPLFKKQRLK